MQLMTTKTTTLAMLAVVALLGACHDGPVGGNLAFKVASSDQGFISLQCQVSSTGMCHFLVGKQFETAYEVKVGESKRIAAPTSALPFCATTSASSIGQCNKQTTIGPGPIVNLKT
jgi:tetrahydromethanopterin S-methyltransferase subunit A